MKLTHKGKEITAEQIQRGAEAQAAWSDGQNPVWAKDADKLDAAKTYALKSHSPASEIFWQLVAHKYEVDGGVI